MKKKDYKTGVFEYLDNMPVGAIKLTELCKPETRNMFIEAVKEYINQATWRNFCIEFTSDWTKIKKFNLI